MRPQQALLAISSRSERAALEQHLREAGFDLAIAADGVECLSALRVQTPDVMVLEFDLLWGGSDGVLAVMGDDPALCRVPIVIWDPAEEGSANHRIWRFLISDCIIGAMPVERLARRIRRLVGVSAA